MPIVPLLKKRLDSIADGIADAVEDYPGDPLDVAHVLLCAAVETMVHYGLDQDQIRELVSVVIDDDGDGDIDLIPLGRTD